MLDLCQALQHYSKEKKCLRENTENDYTCKKFRDLSIHMDKTENKG